MLNPSMIHMQPLNAAGAITVKHNDMKSKHDEQNDSANTSGNSFFLLSRLRHVRYDK